MSNKKEIHEPKSVDHGPLTIPNVVTVIETELGPLFVRKDGRLWEPLTGVGQGVVPLSSEEYLKRYGGEKQTALLQFDRTFQPPSNWLKKLRLELENAADGESVAYLGRKPLPDSGEELEYEWIAIVPPQEASASHFQTEGEHADVSALDTMYDWAQKNQWEIVGHMHIHPKGMVSCSITDTNDWKKHPGIYFVAPRATGEIGRYASLGGIVFNLKPIEVKDIAPADEIRIVTETGAEEWKDNIKKPVVIVRSSYVRSATGYGFGRGYTETVKSPAWSHELDWAYGNYPYNGASTCKPDGMCNKCGTNVAYINPRSGYGYCPSCRRQQECSTWDELAALTTEPAVEMSAVYCTRCGARLTEKTRVCPNPKCSLDHSDVVIYPMIQYVAGDPKNPECMEDAEDSEEEWETDPEELVELVPLNEAAVYVLDENGEKQLYISGDSTIDLVELENASYIGTLDDLLEGYNPTEGHPASEFIALTAAPWLS
jgi:hypothetical protein